MSVDLKLTIVDDASSALKAKIDKCSSHKVALKTLVPCVKHWRNHLSSMPHNRNGWPSTGFWESAALPISRLSRVEGGTVILESDKLGLRQRLHGGTISARNHKYITIPICAEAYGTKVSDWGIENLVLVILADKRKFFALWLGSDSASRALGARRSNPNYAHRAEVSTRRANKFRTANDVSKKPDVIIFRSGGSNTGARAERNMNIKFLFVLKESVEQQGNPNVIPADLGQVAFDAVIEATK
jgi:hypothetical protein